MATWCHLLKLTLFAVRLQVGVVRAGADGNDRSFRVLTNEEVDHFLTIISERD